MPSPNTQSTFLMTGRPTRFPPRIQPPLANAAEKPTAVKERGEVPRKDGEHVCFLGKLAALDTHEEGGGALY